MKPRVIIIYVYNSCDDPLFKGNLLLLLQHVGLQQPDLRLHLITYEQVEYALSPSQQQQRHQDFAHYHIYWHPLKWHSGRFKLVKKAYDLVMGIGLVLRLKLFSKARSIVSLGTISGSFAYLMARMFGLRYYGYQYEPHSEFMLDCRVWSENSLAYKGLHYLEKVSGMNADILSTGTEHMVQRLRSWGSQAQVYKLPSCVDEAKMQFRPAGRQRIRHQIGVAEDRPVILYLGKFGGIYYEREVATLFKAFLAERPDLFFLIVSPDAADYVQNLMTSEGLLPEQFAVTRSPYEQVPDYISAADFGVVAVPSFPSQRFRSPIKVGEYLCCGLPYLVCAGVSEDDRVAGQYNVGVVVSEFSTAEAARVWPGIQQLLAENKEQSRIRCREAGIAYRGLTQYLPIAEDIFAQL
ncbi:glycosyltransferase [Hymenobacter nivis]|nr:glycosyltransferase [Hymenobacter nivis]